MHLHSVAGVVKRPQFCGDSFSSSRRRESQTIPVSYRMGVAHFFKILWQATDAFLGIARTKKA